MSNYGQFKVMSVWCQSNHFGDISITEHALEMRFAAAWLPLIFKPDGAIYAVTVVYNSRFGKSKCRGDSYEVSLNRFEPDYYGLNWFELEKNRFEPVWTSLSQLEPVWTERNRFELGWTCLNQFNQLESQRNRLELVWTRLNRWNHRVTGLN